MGDDWWVGGGGAAADWVAGGRLEAGTSSWRGAVLSHMYANERTELNIPRRGLYQEEQTAGSGRSETTDRATESFQNADKESALQGSSSPINKDPPPVVRTVLNFNYEILYQPTSYLPTPSHPSFYIPAGRGILL